MDRIGRKLSLSFTAVPIFLSWLFIYLGTNYAWLFFARFIGGIGTGAIFALLPMYIGEVTQEKVRGALGVLITVMVTAGNLITYTVGPWVTREILALISAVPSIIFILTFIWMPESPYYLIMKKRSTEAANSLAWLRDTLMVKEELRRITEQVEIEQKSKGKITEIVTVPGNRKAMMIILGLLSAQQFSGTIPLLSYATLIFQQAAYSLHPNISVIIVGVVTLIFSLLAVLLVDKVGRKPLLLFSSAGTCFCLCLLAIFFHLQYANMNVSSISWLPLVTIILFNVPYSMGIGSLPNAVLSEIFPTNVKAWATMLASTYGSLLGMILIKLFQVISDAKDVFAAFYTLAAIEASFIFFIYFIVPETKNKSLKEIQEILHSHVTKSNAIIHT
ncbi:facilitated trehalose transporter Tret1 isoform X2 [Cephus cinctus]|uniref:Facilitated trehalose transporter Tret1 isoform X2 n=1 Tax=Cephus cinctus TaxID=211228 RepID=A0AAJ7BYP1_CEPCN|nr:facilitated trehalose transporter Tret1 isoform X2 [Cephus cinctus]